MREIFSRARVVSRINKGTFENIKMQTPLAVGFNFMAKVFWLNFISAEILFPNRSEVISGSFAVVA